MKTSYPNTISMTLEEAEEFEVKGGSKPVYNKHTSLLIGRLDVEDFIARKRVVFTSTYVPIVVCVFTPVKTSKPIMDLNL